MDFRTLASIMSKISKKGLPTKENFMRKRKKKCFQVFQLSSVLA